MAETASGIGTFIAIAEALSMILDILLLAGWNPGHYNSEFDNRVYDDLARAWEERKLLSNIADIDPLIIMSLFSRDIEGHVTN